ncbi:hypothetical protein ACFL96_17230 [Thermoproteota archaeon]
METREIIKGIKDKTLSLSRGLEYLYVDAVCLNEQMFYLNGLPHVSEMDYNSAKEKGGSLVCTEGRVYNGLKPYFTETYVFLERIMMHAPEIEAEVRHKTGNPEYFNQDKSIKEVMSALCGKD